MPPPTGQFVRIGVCPCWCDGSKHCRQRVQERLLHASCRKDLKPPGTAAQRSLGVLNSGSLHSRYIQCRGLNWVISRMFFQSESCKGNKRRLPGDSRRNLPSLTAVPPVSRASAAAGTAAVSGSPQTHGFFVRGSRAPPCRSRAREPCPRQTAAPGLSLSGSFSKNS